MPPLPSFSAVVEWENAKLSGAARATEMLRILLSQSAALAARIERPPELIVLYDGSAIAPEIIKSALAGAGAATSRIDVRIEAVADASYYKLKNIGAAMATRDYVLFVDSDVLPEPGWLRALLGSARAGADVVAGDTFVDPTTFLGRVFASFWFFPLRSNQGGLRQSKHFFANNVLFRRDLFLQHQFPGLPLYRGQCRALGIALRQSGTPLFIQGDARVCHPPPEPSEIAHRALCEGHDRTIGGQLKNRIRDHGLNGLRRMIQEARDTVEQRGRQLEMPAEEIAVALDFATSYTRLLIAGARWTARRPEQAAAFLGIPSGRHAPFQCRRLAAWESFEALTDEPSLQSPAAGSAATT